MPTGFLEEIKRVTITDSQDNNEQEEKELRALADNKKKAIQETVKVSTTQSSDSPIQAPVMDEAKFQELLQLGISTAVRQVTESHNEQKAQEIEQIRQQAEADTQKKLEAVQADNQAQLQKNQEIIAQTQEQLKQSQQTISRFEDLFKLTGSQNPLQEKHVNFNTHVAANYDEPLGAVKEAFDFFEKTPKVRRTVQGSSFLDFDKSEMDLWMRDPKNRQPFLRDLNTWGKKRGWFSGSTVTPVTEAATTISDLPGGFLPTLSSFIRTTHRAGLVFWQFPSVEFNFAKGKGDTIQVGRFNYLTSSDTLSDYELSGGSTFSPIVSTSDNISTSVVDIVLKEYGRGKAGASTAISPVSIPSFVEFTSAYNLMMKLDGLLGHDYALFEDKMIRSFWNATTRVLYNDNGRVTATVGDLAAGDKGVITDNFMIYLYEYAHTLKIEPLADGCFIWVMPPRPLAQFKETLKDDWEAPSKEALQDFTNYLNPSYIPPEDFSRVSGYIGKYHGFHIFETNAYGIGAAGTDGVQSETIAGSSRVTRSSWIAGRDTIGRGIAMPFEVRMDSVTNFDRESRLTWLSWEGFDYLDVDPSIEASQQLRVIEVHTLDNAI